MKKHFLFCFCWEVSLFGLASFCGAVPSVNHMPVLYSLGFRLFLFVRVGYIVISKTSYFPTFLFIVVVVVAALLFEFSPLPVQIVMGLMARGGPLVAWRAVAFPLLLN